MWWTEAGSDRRLLDDELIFDEFKDHLWKKKKAVVILNDS
jgi:hypothetical protein